MPIGGDQWCRSEWVGCNRKTCRLPPFFLFRRRTNMVTGGDPPATPGPAGPAGRPGEIALLSPEPDAASGRYSLVDVSSAEGDAVKGRSLRQCNGCEAAIALKLGADQSFVGVVTRISRTEYAVRFQIRDAHTGGLVLAQQSDLRIGADYSWNRGAAALINKSLLSNP